MKEDKNIPGVDISQLSPASRFKEARVIKQFRLSTLFFSIAREQGTLEEKARKFRELAAPILEHIARLEEVIPPEEIIKEEVTNSQSPAAHDNALYQLTRAAIEGNNRNGSGFSGTSKDMLVEAFSQLQPPGEGYGSRAHSSQPFTRN